MENTKIYQKWEDMNIYLYGAIRSYPKSEKFTLAAKTVDISIDIGSDFSVASSISDRDEKKRLLNHADTKLVRLKILIRMAMLLRFLPIKKYEILCGQTTEIGKMLGGWKKSASI